MKKTGVAGKLRFFLINFFAIKTGPCAKLLGLAQGVWTTGLAEDLSAGSRCGRDVEIAQLPQYQPGWILDIMQQRDPGGQGEDIKPVAPGAPWRVNPEANL